MPSELNYLRGQRDKLHEFKAVMRDIFPLWHKTKRMELGYTQRELGEKMFLCTSATYRYEAGLALPRDLEAYVNEMNQLKGKRRTNND